MLVLLFELLAVAGIAIMLLCHPRRDDILAVLIGVAAGFTDLQVARVHVFTILVFVWVLFKLGRRTNNTVTLVLVLSMSTTLVAATVLIGDLVVNPTLALQLIALTVAAAAVALYSTPNDQRRMLHGLLFILTFSGLVAIAQVAQIIPSEVSLIVPDQLIHLEISSIGRPSGLTPEPDWLGMMSGIGIFLAFSLDLTRWVRVFALGICSVSWLLAFARAAWVGVLIVVVLLALPIVLNRNRALRSSFQQGRGFAASIVAVVLAVTTVVVGGVSTDVWNRLQQTVAGAMGSTVPGDDGGLARFQQVDSLLYLAEHSPFYGHGLSAAGRVGVSGKLYLTGPSPNSVASNWVLGLWVDARYLAIPFFLLIAYVLVRSFSTLPGRILALVCFCSLISNATYFPVFWLALGLSLCAIAARSSREAATPDVTTPYSSMYRSRSVRRWPGARR
ncbi:hypothetical protein AB0362_06825 [Rhodococcus sp. NPDC079359]|uniref:hypothetical protein n=1 Tax=Rhodococcus sp. NPDC079359 TaxID=3154961 RepID=UPI00344D01D5